jgi:glycosyltransferase involved in cell wall biosynthesis
MVVHQDYYTDARVQNYAKALANHGAQVDILCTRPEYASLPALPRGVTLYPVPVGRGYKGWGHYVLEVGSSLLLYGARLLALHLKHRYQVIHAHNMPDVIVFSGLTPKLLGAKLLLDIHDPMPEFYMAKFGMSKRNLVERLLRVEERISCLAATAVIAASDPFRENLIKRGVRASKITVVRNMPDPLLFDRVRYDKPGRSTDGRFTLFYAGTIAPRYGLHVAVQAMPALVKDIPGIRLVIIGTITEYARELVTLAEQLGVPDAVEVRPAIPLREVPGQMAQADVGIYTALPDAHMSIATPGKVLEYATMGIPVVASRLPVLEQMLGDPAVIFFEPGNVAQFADQVRRLYKDPELGKTLVQAADAAFVQRRSWASEQQAYLDLLARLTHRDSVSAEDAAPSDPAGRL